MANENPYLGLADQLQEQPETQASDNPYAGLADQLESNQSQELVSSIKVASERQPDRHAEVMKISNKMKLPTDFVERNFDEVKRAHEEEELGIDGLMRAYPKTSDFLKNPDHASVTRDKLANLKRVENAVEEHGTLSKLYSTIKAGFAKAGEGIAKFPAFAYDMMLEQGKYGAQGPGPFKLPPMQLKYDERERTETVKKLSDNPVAKYFAETAAGEMKKVPELSQNGLDALSRGDVRDAGRIFAYQVINNMPNMAVMIGASIVTKTPAAGLAFAGASSAGEAHGEALKKEGVSASQRLTNAMISGTAEAAFESVGTFGVLKHWEGIIAKQYGKEMSKQVMKEITKGIGYSMLAEGNEEFWTSIVQDTGKYMTGVDNKATEGMLNRALNAMVVGALSGGTTTSAFGMAGGYLEAKKATAAKDTFLAIGESLEESQIKSRLPEAQRAFVEQVTKDGPLENVYMSLETFENYFQTKGAEPAVIANQLGIIQQLEQARETGDDIKIPLASLTTNLSRELYVGLADDVKFDPNAKTKNELKKDQEELQAQMQEMAKPESQEEVTDQTFVGIRDEISQQLMETGKFSTKKDADISALPMARVFITMGKRSGKSPVELMRKYFGGVEAAEFKSGQGGLFQTLSPLGFYSQVESEIDKMDFKSIPAKDLSGRIKNIAGLKKEELENLGLLEWLSATEGKVSKDQVLKFIKENGIQVEQVVLSEEFEDGGAVAEPDWQSPERDNSYNENDIQSEYEYYSSDDYWTEEQTLELRNELIEDFTNEDGDIDESGLSDAIEERKKERSWELAEDAVQSDDYSNIKYTVTDDATGWTLRGSDEIGWYSDELDKHVDGNLEEVKIKLIPYMIARGKLSGRISDYILKEQIEWFDPVYAEAPDKGVVTRKAKALLNKDPEKYLVPARESNQFWLEEGETTNKDYEDRVAKDALDAARDEVLETYKDEKNKNNKVISKINHEFLGVRLVGNDVSGYTIETKNNLGKFTSNSELSKETIPGPLKSAQEKTVLLLQENGYIKGDGSQSGADIEKPTGKTNFHEGYGAVLPGPRENYREILLTVPRGKPEFLNPAILEVKEGETEWTFKLPGEEIQWDSNDIGEVQTISKSEYPDEIAARIVAASKMRPAGGTFIYTAHFSQKNIVAHVRLTERTSLDGKRVLVAEEIQSDWAQQGRDNDFRDAQFKKALKEAKALFSVATNNEAKALEKLEAVAKQHHEHVKKSIEPKILELRAKQDALREKRSKLRDERDSLNNEANALDEKYEKASENFNTHVERLGFLGFRSVRDARIELRDEPGDLGKIYNLENEPEAYAAVNEFRDAYQLRQEKINEVDFVKQEIRQVEREFDKRVLEIDMLETMANDFANVPNKLQREIKNSDNEEYTQVKANYGVDKNQELESAFDNFRRVSKEVEIASEEFDAVNSAIADMPFKNTESWAALAVKKLLSLAVKEGFDSFGWFPAQVHVDRWGTETVSWKKDGDKFIVSSKEIEGGLVDGGNIEELARQRGELLERYGVEVTSFDEFKQIIKDTLSRGRTKKAIDRISKRIWDKMQTSPEGTDQPRKAGMKFFYDEMLPNKVVKPLLKKLDKNAKIEVKDFDAGRSEKRTYTGPTLSVDEINKIIETTLKDQSVVFTKQARAVIDRLNEGEDFASAMSDQSPGLAEYFGGKLVVEQIKQSALTVPITEEIKKSVSQGLTLYQTKDVPLGAAEIVNNKATIKLFEGANKSTFLHESGHVFLNVLSDMASQEGANEQIKQDFQTVLNWFGVDSADKITVEHHEKFARGFEAYLMEGRAPTSDLRQAFARFRVWLVNIYKHLASLNVTLSDDIRGVMDRMIAADEEINREYEFISSQSIIPTPESLGLNQADFDKYVSALDEAKLAAREKLDAKLQAEFEREKTAFMREERERIESEVKQEAYGMRVFKAIMFFTKGQNPDGTPHATKQFKVNKSALIEMYNKELLSRLPKGLTSDEGVPPIVAAEMFGYESVDQMIQEMSQNQSMKAWIEAETTIRFDDLYPGIKGEALEEETIKAVHNESRSKLLRMELEYLAKNNLPALRGIMRRVASRVPTAKDVRAQAQRIVNQKTIRELFGFTETIDGKRKRTNSLLIQSRRNEVKYANEAAKLLAKGDILGAFEAKRKELLNHELFLAASEAEEFIDKAQTRWKKLNKSDEELAKSRDVDMVNAARAVLYLYGVGTEKRNPVTFLKKLQAYDPEAFGVVSNLVEAVTETAAPIESITYDQLVDLNNVVQALWDMSRENKLMDIEGKKVSIEEAGGEIVPTLMQYTKKDTSGVEKMQTPMDEFFRSLLGWKSALTRVEHWSRMMGPQFTKYIYQPIKDAAVNYRVDRIKYLKEMRAILEPLRDQLESKKTYKIAGLEYEFTKAQILGMLLHSGNESNLKKLLLGRKWGELREDGSLDRSRFDAIRMQLERDGVITKADYDAVQGIWDLFEKLKPMAQRSHKKLYGHFFDEITANEFETSFGVYRGGYVPAIADKWLTQDAQIRADKEAIEQQPMSTMFPQTGRGFTKARVENYNVPLVMDLKFLPQHIDKVLRFAHIQPAATQVARLLNNQAVLDEHGQSVRGAFDAYDPTVISEMLVPFITRAATQVADKPAMGWAGKLPDKLMRYTRKNASMQIMAFNIVNALQNYTGIFLTAADVGSTYAAKASWNYLRSPKKTAEYIAEQSDFMKTRITKDSVEVQKAIHEMIANPSKFDRVKDNMAQSVRILSKMSQDQMEIVAWLAAYDQATSMGLDHAKSVKEADSAVRRTQSSMDVEDISAAEVQSPFTQLFLMFYSYFNNWVNLLGTKAVEIQRDVGIKNKTAHMAHLYFMAFYLPATIAAVMAQASKGKWDDDDDGEYLDDTLNMLLFSHLKTLTAFVPGVGQMANALIGQFTEAQYDDRISMSPAVQIGEKVVSIPKNIYRLTAEDKRPGPAIKDSLTAFGYITGLPLAPVGKSLGYAADVEAGFITPANELDYGRGVLTGKGSTR